MSDDLHSWKVVRGVNGWHVEHSGPTKMCFRPDQYGKLPMIAYTNGRGSPPMTGPELRQRIKPVRARLPGKRFGDRFSDTRRNVCCEYAAELNKEA